ncbi:MAG: hypothetical protein ACYDH5_14940 [Acidimicrobiales bacterium]
MGRDAPSGQAAALAALREWVRTQRVEQGSPPTIEDPKTLDMVAPVLDYAAADDAG